MSESAAELALRNAGMLAPTQEQEWEEIDRIFSGRPPAVKFATQGDSVTGTVTHMYKKQATVFGTNEPKTYDDGSPILEAVLELSTEAGPVSLYVSSWRMRQALQEAFQTAQVRGPRPGGQLFVQYYADEPGKPGATAAKVYRAAYDTPEAVAAAANRVNLGPSARLGPAPELATSVAALPESPPF
jgi:hypothetical protein